MHNRLKSGFTIVELLIVIVVIGILAAITIVAFNGVQQKARDTQRKSDLAAIAKMIQLRATSYDTFLRAGDTCTNNVTGFLTQTGISMTGSNYGANSAMTCLLQESNSRGSLTDPSGATSCLADTQSSCFVYMYASCSTGSYTGTYLYAHLESIPMTSTATDETCINNYDSIWGMNYYVKV